MKGKRKKSRAERKARFQCLLAGLFLYGAVRVEGREARKLSAAAERLVEQAKRGIYRWPGPWANCLMGDEAAKQVLQAWAARYDNRSGGMMEILRCPLETGGYGRNVIVRLL